MKTSVKATKYTPKKLNLHIQKTAKYELIPWVEKYRPTVIDDLVMDDALKATITKIIEQKDMPNLILNGTPGIGKTTTAKCIANAYYGKYYKDAVLELNASDDRGKKSVQNDIDTFCTHMLSYPDGEEKRYSHHKLVILDEADNITEKAQYLISTIIEKHYKNTRFIFTCNTSSDVIESIQSKCKILRYTRIDDGKLINRLKDICSIENVHYDSDGLQTIATLSQGDMRHAINLLQLVYNRSDKITTSNVNEACDKPQPIIIKDILEECIKGNLKESVTKTINLKKTGYSGIDIILGIITTLKLQMSSTINIDHKMIIMKTISKYAYNMSKGVDTDLQLSSCIAEICYQFA